MDKERLVMRRISVFAATVFAALMCSEAFGSFVIQGISDKTFYVLHPEAAETTSIDFESLDELFSRAMGSESGDVRPDPKAQYELGVMFYRIYQAGEIEGSAKYSKAKTYAETFNLTQSAYWLKQAVKNNYLPARYLLSVLDYWFLGEHKAAFKLLDEAAQYGYSRAQARQAHMLRNGFPARFQVIIPRGEDARKRILNQAFALANRSANQGDAYGMYVLSVIYMDTDFDKYDKVKSLEWLQKAINAAKHDPFIEIGRTN